MELQGPVKSGPTSSTRFGAVHVRQSGVRPQATSKVRARTHCYGLNKIIIS
jgi:hypothetical protein